MIEKIKTFLFGNGVVILAFILAVAFALNSVQVIVRNWRLQRQINLLGSEVALLRAENERLTYDIAYYKTDQYLEQALREKLNLKAPNEHVAVITHSADDMQPDPISVVEDTERPERSNWQAWMDFINGRSSQ